MRTVFIFILSICIAVASALDTVPQTSWFNGPGLLNPFPDWSDQRFFSSENVDYRSADGYLSLTLDTCLIDSSLQTCSYLKAFDFDFDGDDDLFAATESDGVLKWYENSSAGASWQEHFISDSINTIYRFDLADFFSDGIPDLAAVCPNDGILLLFEYTGSTWTSTVMDNALSEPIGLCITDINNDGLLDIVVTEREEELWGGVSWYENTGSGPTGWPKHTISADMVGPTTVYASDYDYDGDQDLCVVDLYGDAVYLCRNEYPAQTWVTTTVAEVTSPEAAPFVDIDGTGNIDIVIGELGMPSGGPPGALYWAKEASNGEWLLQDLDPDFNRVHWCASVDMDQDGDNDIYATQVTMSTSNGSMPSWCSWWENLNSGSQWIRHDIWLWGVPSISRCRGRFMEDADFNGDGSTDFAVTPYTWGTVNAPILWVDPSIYTNQASLTSSILSMPSSSDWQSFFWDASCPSGTAIVFQARTGTDPETLGDWSDTLFTPGSLEGYVEDGSSFFQYKVILQTDIPTTTPVLDNVTLTLESLGIDQDQNLGSICSFNLSPNPSGSPLTISLTISETADAELICFNISGRSVWSKDVPDLSSGTHEFELPELPAGLYLIRLKVANEILLREAILLD